MNGNKILFHLDSFFTNWSINASIQVVVKYSHKLGDQDSDVQIKSGLIEIWTRFQSIFILAGPIAFDLCGREGATQAIGFLLGICSIPLTIGPFVAGVFYEKTQSFTLPLVIAGIPPVFGSVAMFLVRCIKPQASVQNGKSIYPEKSSSGRLIQKAAMSTKILCDKSNVRCYNYSDLWYCRIKNFIIDNKISDSIFFISNYWTMHQNEKFQFYKSYLKSFMIL